MIRKGDPRDILVTKFEIDVDNTFHLKNLYKTIFEWATMEGFSTADGKGAPESLYWERRHPNGLTEHHIWWRFVRVPDKNQYYRYFLKIDYQSLAMSKAEVMYSGKKVGSNKGELILRVQGWMQIDYQDKWKNNPVTKFFNTTFKNRVYKQQIDFFKTELKDTCDRLRNTVKTYLKLEQPIKPQKPFMPERGV